MALEDPPGEQIDKRFEEICHEEFGVFEHARRFTSDAATGFADKYRDMPGEDDAGVF